MQKHIGDFIRNDELQKQRFDPMDKVHRTIVYVEQNFSAVIISLFFIKFSSKRVFSFVG